MSEVLADELPCEVFVRDREQTYQRCRAVITDEGVSVYREERPGDAPVLVLRSRHLRAPELPVRYAPRRRRRYLLQTEVGEVLVNATAGCLCVYPSLRGYTPETLAASVRSGVIAAV